MLIDVEEPKKNINVIVILTSFKDRRRQEDKIQYHFSNDFNLKLEQYHKLKQLDKSLLETG
jgi:hypothetical protein